MQMKYCQSIKTFLYLNLCLCTCTLCSFCMQLLYLANFPTNIHIQPLFCLFYYYPVHRIGLQRINTEGIVYSQCSKTSNLILCCSQTIQQTQSILLFQLFKRRLHMLSFVNICHSLPCSSSHNTEQIWHIIKQAIFNGISW